MSFRTVGEKPQTEMLLDHLGKKSNISDLEARAILKIRALPRRIKDLKERGHRFRHEWRVDSTGQRYVRYHYQGRD